MGWLSIAILESAVISATLLGDRDGISANLFEDTRGGAV